MNLMIMSASTMVSWELADNANGLRIKEIVLNPEHPWLHPNTFVPHNCTGAECDICGVFAIEKSGRLDCTHRLVGGFQVTLPTHTQVVPRHHERLVHFRDGRGLHVTTWPKALAPSTTIILPHGNHWHEGSPWQVLVHQRRDNGYWGFPGGMQEIGESLVECASREMREETGLSVYILGAVALDSDPIRGALCVYEDGVMQYTNVTFLATWLTGDLWISKESLFLRWVNTDALPEPFLQSHRWRLQQAMRHRGEYIAIR